MISRELLCIILLLDISPAAPAALFRIISYMFPTVGS